MRVELLDGAGDRWQSFVASHPDATFFHRLEWRRLLEDVYGYAPRYLVALEDDEVVGVLPMFRVDSRLFGRTLKSLPFQFLGGPVSSEAPAQVALVEQARALAAEEKAAYVELKSCAPQLPGAVCTRTYTRYVTDLSNEPWARLSENVRRQIKRAGRQVEVVPVEDFAGLDRFYDHYRARVQRLGIPAHHPRLFRGLWAGFGGSVRITLAIRHGQPIGNLVCLMHRDRMTYWWGFHDPGPVPAMHALHWEAMQWAGAHGLSRYDFGVTSPVEDGQAQFKSRWGSVAEAVFFYRAGGETLPIRDYHTGFGVARRAWRLLPARVAHTLGPRVAREIG